MTRLSRGPVNPSKPSHARPRPHQGTPVVLPEMPKRDKATPPHTPKHSQAPIIIWQSCHLSKSPRVRTSAQNNSNRFPCFLCSSDAFRYDVLLPDGAFSMQMPAACPTHVPALLSNRTHRADLSRSLIPNDAKPPAERFRSAQLYTQATWFEDTLRICSLDQNFTRRKSLLVPDRLARSIWA
jgi:hypothetical protein